jgi:hypothetical protein
MLNATGYPSMSSSGSEGECKAETSSGMYVCMFGIVPLDYASNSLF